MGGNENSMKGKSQQVGDGSLLRNRIEKSSANSIGTGDKKKAAPTAPDGDRWVNSGQKIAEKNSA